MTNKEIEAIVNKPRMDDADISELTERWGMNSIWYHAPVANISCAFTEVMLRGAAVAFGLMGMAEMIGRRCCFACGKFGGMDPPGPDGSARWVCDCSTSKADQDDEREVYEQEEHEYRLGAAALGGILGMAEAIRANYTDYRDPEFLEHIRTHWCDYGK